MESVSEARGLISDLLMNEDSIPQDTQQKLRRVKDILALRSDRALNSPKITYGEGHRRGRGSGCGHGIMFYDFSGMNDALV